MASYHGPKARIQRRFGEVLVSRPKYARIIEARPYPPGDHGREKQFKSGRRSDYGLQLDEKQKLSFVYNVRERQLRNYYKKATTMSGRTGQNLLSLLETRLDNIVFRAGFAATIWQARQYVGHGHILVNGRRLDLPSYQLRDGDVVEFTDKMKKNVQVVETVEGGVQPVPYLSVDSDARQATFLRQPDEGEIPNKVDLQLVVEYYNRLT
jgi:small subunit ribosomal protein S4